MKNITVICLLTLASISVAKPLKSLIANKNGFFINDENSYVGAEQYIQDGLIAMWDAIENVGWGVHDDYINRWVDLVNGLEFIVDAGGSWSSNSFECDGIATGAYIYFGGADTSTKDFIYQKKQFEVVFKINTDYARNTLAYVLHCRTSGSKPMIAVVKDIYDSISINKRLNEHSFNQEKHFASCASYPDNSNVSFLFYDGNIIYNLNSTGFGSFGNFFTLGSESNRTQNYCKCSIYCIRLYDRELTQEEILYNYTIDKARFGL